jgi:hypothetical protein
MKFEKKNSLTHSKSAEFLCSYSWKGKSKEQIIDEMKLPDYERKYLEDAMHELAPQGKFTGMDLDEYFVLRMAMDEEDVDPLDDEDIVYMN